MRDASRTSRTGRQDSDASTSATAAGEIDTDDPADTDTGGADAAADAGDDAGSDDETPLTELVEPGHGVAVVSADGDTRPTRLSDPALNGPLAARDASLSVTPHPDTRRVTVAAAVARDPVGDETGGDDGVRILLGVSLTPAAAAAVARSLDQLPLPRPVVEGSAALVGVEPGSDGSDRDKWQTPNATVSPVRDPVAGHSDGRAELRLSGWDGPDSVTVIVGVPAAHRATVVNRLRRAADSVADAARGGDGA